METRQTKEQFIRTVKREIYDNTKLLEFYRTRYLPTIKDFDGMSFDFYRLRSALQSQMTDPLMYFWNDNIHNPSKPQLQLRKNLSQYTTAGERMNVPLVLKNGTIDYHATISIDWCETNTEKHIAMLREIVERYDSLMAVADRFKNAAEDFGKLPRRFRESLCKIYIPQVDR